MMGASLGLAGLAGTGCIRLPEEKLAPYAHRPENRTPGTPVSYATAMEIGGVAQGLLVTSFDGRPTKIEGNPSHPLNRGAADLLAQASVLELYDPDRSFGVVYRKDGKTIDAVWRPSRNSASAPSSVMIKVAFDITVSAMDANGNTVSNYVGKVRFFGPGGTSGLPANYTFTEADAGSRVFSVTLGTLGEATINVQDAATGDIKGSVAVKVVSAAKDAVENKGEAEKKGESKAADRRFSFAEWAKAHFKGDGGDLCILSEAGNSPSLAALRAKFQEKFPKAEWFEYEPLSDDNVREGTFAAFGQHVLPVLELADAKVIVSLDANLFGDGSPLAIKNAREFAAGRRLHDEKKQKPEDMNRLYVIEPLHTITGASADHRLARRASEIADIATELAAALGVAGVEAPQESKLPLLTSIKNDLEDNMGHAVVVAGPRQPAEVHALVAAINHKLGNVGKTVVYYPDPQPERPSHAAAIETLVKRMETGAISTLLILGGNPVYNAPPDLKFGEALQKVPDSIHSAIYEDENLAALHLAPFAGTLSGVLGRRKDLRRHGEHRPAADRAAL